MKLRALLVVGLAAVGLLATGCQTKVGAAAVVDGQRISETAVQDYVQPDAKSFTVQQQDGSSSTIVPRTYALQQLITIKVLTAVLRKHGGTPTTQELSAARTKALGTSSDADVVKAITSRGFDDSFEPVLIRSQALLTVLETRITDQTTLLKAVTNSGVDVKVSGRYGSWDPKTLSLSSTGSTPDFIATSPAAASSSPASGG